jgi:hypothetical protein
MKPYPDMTPDEKAEIHQKMPKVILEWHKRTTPQERAKYQDDLLGALTDEAP